jgi:hypothetical protein
MLRLDNKAGQTATKRVKRNKASVPCGDNIRRLLRLAAVCLH